jgi:hypothetical protein
MSEVTDAIHNALDYCLEAIGDKKVEGEANKLRVDLRNALGVAAGETHPAAVSDDTTNPGELQRQARANLAEAQRLADEADAAVAATTAPLPPQGAPAAPPAVPAPADMGGSGATEAAEVAAQADVDASLDPAAGGVPAAPSFTS